MRGGWSTKKTQLRGSRPRVGCRARLVDRRGTNRTASTAFSYRCPLELQGGFSLSSSLASPCSAAAARKVQTENQICTEISRLVRKIERVPNGVCLGGGDNATWTSGRDCSRLHENRGRLAIGLHDTNVMGRPAQLPIQRDPGHLGWPLPYAVSESWPQLRTARGPTERGASNMCTRTSRHM